MRYDVQMSQTIVKKHISKVRENVRQILRDYPETRNNDNYLTWLYRKYIDKLPLPYLDYDKFIKLTTFETITRARRSLVESDPLLYAPTDPRIARIRQTREKIFRQIFGEELTEKYYHIRKPKKTKTVGWLPTAS